MPTAPRSTLNLPRDAGWVGAYAIALISITLLASTAAAIARDASPLSLYGLTGVIDTPSARMMDDGDIAITGEAKKPDDRVTIAFQALPWLETTARYSIINIPTPGHALYDRSLGLKLGLMNEGAYRPSFAVGILDIGGTEVFGGEYFVASKRLGPFDTSLGLGFGRLGSVGMFNNPFGLISKKFYDRPNTANLTSTGQLAFTDFFRGRNVSLFGGIVYDTPIHGLQLLAEYSGDKYVAEQKRGLFKAQSQFNVGASYRPLSVSGARRLLDLWQPICLSEFTQRKSNHRRPASEARSTAGPDPCQNTG